MGMYTQYRGFLCVKGLSSDDKMDDLVSRFESLKKDFLSNNENERPWVCNDSCIHHGSNDSGWIFIGSEHKNYDDSMENWIKVLFENFRCEGRIERQYEEMYPGDSIEVLKITPLGIERINEATHQEGYGF